MSNLQITVIIRARCGASEADMSDHMAHVKAYVQREVEQIRGHSWLNRLETSWSEGYDVEFDITVE